METDNRIFAREKGGPGTDDVSWVTSIITLQNTFSVEAGDCHVGRALQIQIYHIKNLCEDIRDIYRDVDIYSRLGDGIAEKSEAIR